MLAACSFAIDQPPPSYPEPDCTSSTTGSIADISGALGGGASAIKLFYESQDGHNSGGEQTAALFFGTVGIPITIAYLWSVNEGIEKITACRRATAECRRYHDAQLVR